MSKKWGNEPLVVVFFLVLTALLYAPVRHAGFVYDDHLYVRNNPGIRQWDFCAFWADPMRAAAPDTGIAKDAYRPAVTVSYAIDYKLWDLSAAGFHLENVALALLNAVLVWLFFRRVLEPASARLLALAIFLWHPVQVQAVAWISQRSTLLASAGMLTALLMLGPPGPWSWGRVLAGWAGFGAALFCRETTGGVILALALLDGLDPREKKPGGDRRMFWARYIGLAVLTAAYLAIRSYLLPRWSELPGVRQWASDAALGLLAFALYIGKLVWPAHLRLHYAYPDPNLWLMMGAAAVTLLYLAAGGWGFYHRRRWAAGLAWIGIFLIPVLQVIPIRAFAAERYLYFSLIGFAWIAGLAYARFRRLRVPLGAAVIFLAMTSARQVPVWHSDESLWAEAVRQDPQDAYAHLAYAGVVKDPLQREHHLRQALYTRPPEFVRQGALTNLSWAALERRQFRAAEAWARAALRFAPDDLHALHNLLRALESQGDPLGAEAVRRRIEKIQRPI